MKSSPILFSDPMVRAILAGEKTQTRRITKCSDVEKFLDGAIHFSDKGSIGDELWVKECFGILKDGGIVYRADGRNFHDDLHGKKWKPSIFMGRAQSRITLEIVAAPHIERLQSITEPDALAEGVASDSDESARLWYSMLWDSINKQPGKRWADNPFVWVISFRRI